MHVYKSYIIYNNRDNMESNTQYKEEKKKGQGSPSKLLERVRNMEYDGKYIEEVRRTPPKIQKDVDLHELVRKADEDRKKKREAQIAFIRAQKLQFGVCEREEEEGEDT